MIETCYCHCPSVPLRDLAGRFMANGKPVKECRTAEVWQAEVEMECPDPATVIVTADPVCPRCGSPSDLSVLSRAAA